MSSMANPIVILDSFQKDLDNGAEVDLGSLDRNYMMMYDEPGVGRRRFSFVKIVVREAQALSIFGLESPIRGIPCYNAGYAVKENCRGRGLAIEAFNIGLEKLKIALRCENLNSFYVEAIIDEKNTSSLAVARKIFPGNGMPMEDGESGTPSLYFVKLIDC